MRRQLGITMIEVLLCIAVFISVTYVVIAGYRVVNGTTRNANLVEDLDSLSRKVRAAYKNRADYTGLTVNGARADRLVPPRMDKVNVLATPFGDATLAPSDPYAEGRNTGFAITLPAALPNDTCSDMLEWLVSVPVKVTRYGSVVIDKRSNQTMANFTAYRTSLCNGTSSSMLIEVM